VNYLKTPQAAKALGVLTSHLHSLLRTGRLDPLPRKDGSGDYCWSPEDLDRAREAMKVDRRRRKPKKPEGAEVACAR
jgi:hypothetical protein